MNEIPTALRVYAMRLFRRGYPARVVAEQTGIAKQTATRIRRGMGYLKCKCGMESGHRGWCWWRVSQSSKRQAFLKRIGRYQGEIRGGIYDGLRVDGSNQHKCECGCGRWTRNGFKFVKGHSKEEKWLKQAKSSLAEVRVWLNESQRSPWLSPQRVSRQGKTSQT